MIISLRHWIIFAAFFISGFNARACTDFPTAESMRFRLLSPLACGFRNWEQFCYSSELYATEFLAYGNSNLPMNAAEEMNSRLWRTYCKNIPTVEAVFEAVYRIPADSGNGFMDYLRRTNDTAALGYLRFAKAGELLNAAYADPWEHGGDAAAQYRQQYIADAITRARRVRAPELQKRYAFLAIRACYYAQDRETMGMLFREYFGERSQHDIIDYWALSFHALTMPSGPERNLLLARVFFHAPDKRFAAETAYQHALPLADVLKYAETADDVAAVWTMKAVRNPGRSLDELEKIAAEKPGHEHLAFLLFREVNKLEDWIYTTTYTARDPILSQYTSAEMNPAYATYLKWADKDRQYAARLLAFTEQQLQYVQHSREVWEAIRISLQLMTEKHPEALATLRRVEQNKQLRPEMREQLVVFRAIALVAAQAPEEDALPAEARIIIREQAGKNNRLLLALARELERKNKTTDAAVLFAKLSLQDPWAENAVCWFGRTSSGKGLHDYFYNYLPYIDAEYTVAQIEDLIRQMERYKSSTDNFQNWAFNELNQDIARLRDLLGTKLLREGRLPDALAAFEKVDDSLWTSKHAIFYQYLDANPFYTDMYAEHRKTSADTIRFTKVTLLKKLLEYITKAENPANPDRDYYNFLVANCYFNMTRYGNSWVMRRYFSYSTRAGLELPDGPDFFTCKTAKLYYLRAGRYARSRPFAALCLRMAGRCEKYRLIFESGEYGSYFLPSDTNSKKIFNANVYYRELKKQFPGDYDELISNCYSFETYFKERRGALTQ